MKYDGKTVAGRKTAREPSHANGFDVRQPQPAMPHTAWTLSSSLISELRRVWLEARAVGRTNDQNNLDGNSAAKDIVVPNFKVGSLEIYKRFPRQYDLLMRRHDCQAVRQFLDDLLSSLQQPTSCPNNSESRSAAGGHEDKRRLCVADFGCGTGRIACLVGQHPAVNAVYCYDGETAMLDRCLVNTVRTVAEARPDTCGVRVCPRAVVNVSGDASDVVFVGDEAKNSRDNVVVCARRVTFADVQQGILAAHPPCQLVVCAWSLSYVMRAQWGDDRWHAALDATLQALIGLLDDSGPAALVVIETLGTDTTEPRRNSTFPQRLESHYGFERRWVRTDYKFRDVAEAVSLTRFFFGKEMAHRMETTKRTTLPECTGIWTLWKN